jgi:hypothetical protein
MTQNGRARVLLVEKFVEEQVYRRTEWVEGEIPYVLGKVEDGKRQREGQMGKRRLFRVKIQDKHCASSAALRQDVIPTSTMMPGTNMTTARAWKNFLLAFTLKTGSL